MKICLALAGILAWLFGAALILAPGAFYAPIGIIMSPLAETVAQAHGATLFGVGTINWLARGAEGRGLRAVLIGNLTIQVLSLAVALRTMMLGPGSAAAPAIAIHITLGILFAFFLIRSAREA